MALGGDGVAEVSECNLSVLQNLIDAGCDTEFAERFFTLQVEGKARAQLDLLATHRRFLLDKIHKEQKHLDCLDYLLYQLRKETSK